MRTKTLPPLLLALLLTPVIARAATPVAVSGQVLAPGGGGPGGSPLQGARVLLMPLVGLAESARLEAEGRSHPDPVATATTGADGAFRLQAPAAGMWKVAVEAPGTVPQEIVLQPLLEPAQLPALRMESDAKLEVRVAGPDGRPLAGARVRIGDMGGRRGSWRGDLRSWRAPDRVAVTDARGVAVLPRGSRERLLVRAGVAGQPFAERREVGSGAVALRLPAGTTREIRVVDAAGKSPVPGVWVRVGESRWLAGRTSEDGRFPVPLSRAGTGRKERIFLAAEDGRALESHAGPAQAEEKGPLILRLPTLETLEGRVVSASDGRAVAGALVWEDDPGAARRTGADGAYRLDLLPGRGARLFAAAPGFLGMDTQVEVQRGLRRGPTLALPPAVVASGVVVDEQGQPVAGVQIDAVPLPVRLRRPAPMPEGGSARTGANGRFRIGGLAAGVGHDLRAARPGYAPATAEAPPLEPGRPGADLRIVLRQGRTGFGRVMDGLEQPVAGARVELRQVRAGDLRMRLMSTREAGPARYEAATDAAGRFEVRNLPAGRYELTARGAGFAPLTVPGLTIPEGGGGTDLGTVILVPGVEIEGRVVDSDGRPLAGAEVRLAESAADPRARIFQDEEPGTAAVSAQDGSFRIADRRAGETVDLSASLFGYAPAAAPDVRVPPDSPVRLVLQPSAAVEGRTVDPDGKPVPGTRVFVHPTDPVLLGGGMRSFSAARGRQAVSDETGFFRLEDVIPGSVELRALATGYQRSELKNLEVRPGQELKGLEVMLAPGAVVEGRVFSPSGQPLAGAEVGLVDPRMDFFFGQVATDGDGRYRLDGVAPGTHSVQAGHEGYRRAVRELEVRLGENTLDLRLESGVEIRGRVVDEGGAPVSGARVHLREGPSSWNGPGAASRADGSFTLEGVADGTYRLLAQKEGFAPSREGVEVTVAGSSLSGIEIKLDAGGAIVGHLSGLDFAELSRVRVWLMSGGRQAGQVSPDGSYRIDHVEPGEHRVTASLGGGAREAEGRVTLEPGAPEARLDLEFGDGLTLTGRVLRNGEAARGLSVSLTGGGRSGRRADTDHEGRFRFEGLDAGTYDLRVHGYRSGSNHRESVELADDRDVLIELDTAAVSGRVVDSEDQRPIPDAQVLLLAAQPEEASAWQSTETTTDSRGLFRLREVAEGSWKVRAVVPGYAPGEVDVEVASGRPVDGVELALQATEGILLEVLLPSGRPPDLVHTVTFDAAGRVVTRATYPTGEDGRVRVESVAPGTWNLFLEAEGAAAIVVPVTAPGNAGRVLLPRPGTLSIKVAGLAEAGVGAKVELTDESGRLFQVPWGGQMMQAFELLGGARRFDKLAPGAWTLEVAAADGRTWTGTATVVPGGVSEVTLE